jgi:AcrR family transcriptional regulator
MVASRSPVGHLYVVKMRANVYGVKMDSTTREAAGRARYHHGDLRRALLDAALELIEENGVSELSLRAVARRAQVSHAAPYHHFADRAALVAAVAEEGFWSLLSAMRARIAGVLSPAQQLQESGIAYVCFALDHPAHFRVMFSAELAERSAHPGLKEAATAAHAALEQVIERCQAAGEVRPGDPRVLSGAAWSLVHGVATLLLDGHFGAETRSAGAAERHAQVMTSVLWEGLRP